LNRATIRATDSAMRPLQLWLPNVTGALALPEVQRDRERAFKAWRGEDVVWLLPGLQKPVRWVEDKVTKVLGIPAEQLDRLDVYHVGENGYVWGPEAEARFPEGRVEGLLAAFLNVGKLGGGIEFYRAPDELQLRVPRIEDAKVVYKLRNLRLEPGSVMPVALAGDESGFFSMHWPPDETRWPTVSPEAESREQFGALESAEYQGMPVAVRREDPEFRALRIILKWLPPLTDLFSPASGADDMHACAKMVALARKSRGDLTGALLDSKAAASRYVTDGETTLWSSWFLPIFAAEGIDGALIAAEARYDVQAANLKEVFQSEPLQQALSETVPIRRAWGAIGLFWALLLERLEEGRSFQSCERCGRIIQGKRGKRFCGRDDDLQCYRQRRATDRRRERQRKT
jgi:hypothetical protein